MNSSEFTSSDYCIGITKVSQRSGNDQNVVLSSRRVVAPLSSELMLSYSDSKLLEQTAPSLAVVVIVVLCSATFLNGCSENNRLSSEFVTAVSQGNSSKVEQIVNDGIDIDVVNEKGESPLMLAILNGDVETVRVLLRYNADVNHRNRNQERPLHYASTMKSDVIAREIIRRSPDLNAQTVGGYTPLLVAVSNRNEPVARMLLDAGADAGVGNDIGTTPLMVAAFQGDDNMCLALLKSGAQVNQANKYGQTALIFAIQGDRKSTSALLTSNGADPKAFHDRHLESAFRLVLDKLEVGI